MDYPLSQGVGTPKNPVLKIDVLDTGLMCALIQNLTRGIMQTRKLLLKAADIEKIVGDRKVH